MACDRMTSAGSRSRTSLRELPTTTTTGWIGCTAKQPARFRINFFGAPELVGHRCAASRSGEMSFSFRKLNLS